MPKIFRLLCVLLIVSAMRGGEDSLDDARAFFLKGDFADAARIFRAVIQRDPECETAHIGLVRALLKNDDVREAHQSAEAALAAFPESPALHADAGDVLFRMSRVSDAQKAYARAIGIDPGNARGYSGLGKIYSFDFNRKSAAKMRRKAYECDPADLDVLYDSIQLLPAAEQIFLLEKFLASAAFETEESKADIAEWINHLKNASALKPQQLKNAPSQADVPLDAVLPSPVKGVRGYAVKARINGGKPVHLLLDTGASGILIHRKLAAKLKLDIIRSHDVKGIGDAGPVAGWIAQADALEIGPLQFLHPKLGVVDKNISDDADGVIGIDMFGRYLTTLNFPKNMLELRPLPRIGNNPYSDPASWEELDRTKCPELASFHSVGIRGHLLIPAVVNDKKAGFFILDTGAQVNLLSREFAAGMLKLGSAAEEIRGISGATKTYAAYEDITLKMGGFTQKQRSMYVISLKDISRHSGFEISGIIGYPLLSHLAVTIDFRDGFIRFQYRN